MGYRRRFKTESNDLAAEIRSELDLSAYDPLDPRILAEYLCIPIWNLSDLVADGPAIAPLLGAEAEQFSAVTVFAGPRRTIVHNDAHSANRQNSNLAHELAHGLLGHPATPALDNKGCREWNQDIEDEATWLAGVLLISEAVTLAVARGRWTKAEAATKFGVSPQMLQFRLNATGAVRRMNKS